MARDQGKSPGDYARWLGLPVSLSLICGEMKTAVPCTILGESDAAVRVRIEDQWDVEIYKDMILGVYTLAPRNMDQAPKNSEAVSWSV